VEERKNIGHTYGFGVSSNAMTEGKIHTFSFPLLCYFPEKGANAGKLFSFLTTLTSAIY